MSLANHNLAAVMMITMKMVEKFTLYYNLYDLLLQFTSVMKYDIIMQFFRVYYYY